MHERERAVLDDLRNAATVLRAAAAQLQSPDEESPALRARLHDMLVRRTSQVSNLLDDLDLIRHRRDGGQPLQLERVALGALCHRAVSTADLAPGVQVDLAVAPDHHAVADPHHLGAVVLDLVSAAERCGGRLLHLSSTTTGPTVTLELRFAGPGLTRQRVPVDGRAYSASRGEDLLLARVREQVADMNGDLEVDLAHGRFEVTLPAPPALPADLGPEDLADQGHSAVYWRRPEVLTATGATYVLQGLAAGEAVLTVLTAEHTASVLDLLDRHGADTEAVVGTGQLVVVDADQLCARLDAVEVLDRRAVDQMVAETLAGLDSRWRRFRCFGESVSVLWQNNRCDVALTLEEVCHEWCARLDFPWLCGYELGPVQLGESIGARHDHVTVAP